jgi:phytanoyl-CoA dioxygenase PhyH
MVKRLNNFSAVTDRQSHPPLTGAESSRVDRVAAELEQNGIVVFSDLVSKEQLSAMQRAFSTRLNRIRWNNLEGYEKERYRHLVNDLLAVDQAFVNLTLHPVVKETLRRYIGDQVELCEAKGWLSLPTKRDFHGWHADAWYDQGVVDYIPKEVKLAVYLTDVRSGAFNYVKGSHQKEHPRYFSNKEVESLNGSEVVEVKGPAGTAFLFDTSGIHRQSVPIVEPRHALFYNYHEPSIKLEAENVTNYRYHPLVLNASFLGNLSAEDQRLLGFGNQTNFIPAYDRPAKHLALQRAFSLAFDLELRARNFHERVKARLSRSFDRRR